MDFLSYNRSAWDRLVRGGDRWTVPVTAEMVARARAGDWQVVLTPTRPVPRDWFPPLAGARVLGLACGGGQQGPILAAAGAAEVVIFDNSPEQLARDREVAARDQLALRCVQGDMADLSALADVSFDLVFHPVSNLFVPDVAPVWREAFRVLRPGGVLLAGFANPTMFLFDREAADRGELVVRHKLPYADVDLPPAELDAVVAAGLPLEWSHSLEAQIAGQLRAGFALTDLFEDGWGEEPDGAVLGRYFQPFLATRAIRPR